MYYGKIINENNIQIGDLNEDFDFLNSIVYNEYLNMKSILENCTSRDVILESQVELLHELSIKDIIDKIANAFKKIIEFIKDKIDKIKAWFKKKKDGDTSVEKMEKDANNTDLSDVDNFNYDDLKVDTNDSDKETTNESAYYFLNEIEVEDKSKRKYYNDGKSSYSSKSKYLYTVRQLSEFIDSLKDKSDLNAQYYTMDLFKYHFKDSKISDYITRICNNDVNFIDSIMVQGQYLTAKAIDDISFVNKDEYKYNQVNGEIKFSSWISGNGGDNDFSKMKKSQIIKFLLDKQKEELEVGDRLAEVLIKMSQEYTKCLGILDKRKLTMKVVSTRNQREEYKNIRDNMSNKSLRALSCILSITQKQINYTNVISIEIVKRTNMLNVYNSKINKLVLNLSQAQSVKKMTKY